MGNCELFLNLLWQIVAAIGTLSPSPSLKKPKFTRNPGFQRLKLLPAACLITEKGMIQLCVCYSCGRRKFGTTLHCSRVWLIYWTSKRRKGRMGNLSREFDWKSNGETPVRFVFVCNLQRGCTWWRAERQAITRLLPMVGLIVHCWRGTGNEVERSSWQGENFNAFYPGTNQSSVSWSFC